MPSAEASQPVRAPAAGPGFESVLLIVNPRSGRGRADGIAGRLAMAAAAAGLNVQRVNVGARQAARLLAAAAGGGDGTGGGLAAVVVGGDGTVHSNVDLLVRSGVPVYHAPTGTENLFARQFGMSASPQAVVEAVRRGRVSLVDVGECSAAGDSAAGGREGGEWRGGAGGGGNGSVNGAGEGAVGGGSDAAHGGATEAGPASLPRPFLVMGSIGFDAGVIHRLAAARRGSISHLSYIGPILRELVSHRSPRLTITVDGSEVVGGARGLAIVANSRQYALRIDPAHRAEMNDGLLDVVFFPARWLTGMSAWAVLSRLRLHHRRKSLVTARGREILVRATEGRAVLQMDGEAIGTGDATEGTWRFGVRPKALRVLGEE